jgi:hypothetical protein
MKAIKKTSTKTIKSLAPAPKMTESAPPKPTAATTKSAVAPTPIAAIKPVAAAPVALKAAAAAAPALRGILSKTAVPVEVVIDTPALVAVAKVKPAASASKPKPVAKNPFVITSTITTKVDIGFGNTLYIRGEGPGLSWDKGAAMNCVADDQWQIVVKEAAQPIVFKVLVNDLSWNTGTDYSVAPGASVVLDPTF